MDGGEVEENVCRGAWRGKEEPDEVCRFCRLPSSAYHNIKRTSLALPSPSTPGAYVGVFQRADSHCAALKTAVGADSAALSGQGQLAHRSAPPVAKHGL